MLRTCSALGLDDHLDVMNFAPYASPPASPPAREALLPGTRPNKSPWMSGNAASSYQSGAGVADLETGRGGSASASSSRSAGLMSTPGNTAEAYETRFGWRVDVEAAVAYAGGPVLAIFLLLVETKNDYARFHAYQSLLVSAALLIAHLVVIWSSFLTYVLFLVDVAVLGSLALSAYRSADTLDRRELPYVGPLAAQWVGEE